MTQALLQAFIADDEPQTQESWVNRALPAYENGKPTFLDPKGELIEGIYLDMPNDVYHSLNALSSTGLKKFIESPAHYYREYLSGIERKRTTAQRLTFDAGTHAHSLVLEPQGYYSQYFRDVMPIDYPDAITTAAQLEAKLVEAGLPKSGTKAEKAKRLLQHDPSIEIFDDLKQKAYEKQGDLKQVVFEGETVDTYGGKIPVDGQVWDDAHRAAKTTRNHAEANAYISNGLPEVAMFYKCPITGLMLKVKFDWLRFDNDAVDLKTTLSTKPEKFNRQINDLHYDIQQEFYKYVALLGGVHIERFTFVATEYVNADICQPFELSTPRMLVAKNKVQKGLKDMARCRTTDKWHGWSKEDCTMVLL